MTIDEIKKAYLKAVGNPESGPFADLADDIAEAIAEGCGCNKKEAKSFSPVEEVRVVKPNETR